MFYLMKTANINEIHFVVYINSMTNISFRNVCHVDTNGNVMIYTLRDTTRNEKIMSPKKKQTG